MQTPQVVALQQDDALITVDSERAGLLSVRCDQVVDGQVGGKIAERLIRVLERHFHTDTVQQPCGLSAPQIGINARVGVICWQGRWYTLINPEIVGHSEDVSEGIESCLSVPGYVGLVRRYVSVRVRVDPEGGGDPDVVDADRFLAMLIQHELDHLDGIVFFERIRNGRHGLIPMKCFRRIGVDPQQDSPAIAPEHTP